MNDKPHLPAWKCIDGSMLKVVAVVTMLIDHIACFLLYKTDAGAIELFTIGGRTIILYKLMRMVGRIAFPIFAFLIVEGFIHTGNRSRYGLNLFIFALISEIPWNLVHTGTLFFERQNVMFTLFLGFLGMYVIENFRKDRPKMFLFLALICFLAYFLRADYGFWGYAFILLLYLLHPDHMMMTTVGGMIFMGRGLSSLPAFVLIGMYNGKRGFIKGPVWKYAFYAFYPLHLLAIWLFKVLA